MTGQSYGVSAAGENRRHLRIVLALTSTYLVAEDVGDGERSADVTVLALQPPETERNNVATQYLLAISRLAVEFAEW